MKNEQEVSLKTGTEQALPGIVDTKPLIPIQPLKGREKLSYVLLLGGIAATPFIGYYLQQQNLLN